MKLKTKLFVALSACALVGGAVAGISAGRMNVIETKAATETTIYYSVSDEIVGAGNSVRINYKKGSGSGDGDGWGTDAMTKTAKTYGGNPIYTVTFTDSWNGLYVLQFQKVVSGNPSDLDVPINYYWTSVASYQGKMWVHGGSEWQTYIDDSMTTYDVTMYAVVDGINEGQIGSDTADAANAYNPEDPAFKANYSFDGWFTNADCAPAHAYSAVAPTEDLNLYAKFTHLDVEVAEKIYIVTGYNTSWSGRYIYTYASDDTENASKKSFGEWPGTPIEKAYLGITVATNFGGGNNGQYNGGIMKFACYTQFGSDKVIIHNNNGSQVELDIVDGAAYFYSGLSDGEYQGNTGKAAEVIYDFDKELGSTGSPCSSSVEKAASLYNEYVEANKTDTGWLKSSVLTTSNYSGDYIASGFRSNVLNASRTDLLVDSDPKNNLGISIKSASNNLPAIIAIVSAAAVVAFGGLLIIRRKRDN